MAFVFRRSNGIYYVVRREGNKSKWLSTGCRTLEEALAVTGPISSDRGRSSVMTVNRFAEKIQAYAKTNLSAGTQYLYDVCFRHLEKAIGNKALKLVTVDDIEKYKAERLKKVSRTRVNIELRTLRAAFRKAVSWGRLSKSPFSQSPLLRVPYTEAAYLTQKEFVQLYRAMSDKRMREIVVFALATGMRRGEIVNLEWQDVDFDDRVIRIRNKQGFTLKGMRPRTIPMSSDVQLLLFAKRQQSGFVFTDQKGRKLTGYNLSRQFKRFARKAGLRSEIHFHSLRHSFTSWWKGDIVELQKLLGHANLTTTQIYSHRGIEDLRATVDKVKVLDLISNVN